MNRSSRLKNILNRRKDLWNHSDIESDHEKKINSNETSSDENENLSSKSCCLICSILPNLSTINTCEKHLNLLTKSINSTQVVYMMHPAIHNCHCRLKYKHRYRSSSSSSSSSSEYRHHRKKRSMTVLSSDTENENDLFFSPNVQSQIDQSRLSPSLPPSTTINMNKNYNELLLTSFLQRNSSDIIEIDSNSSNLSHQPIVHVKDDNELLNDNHQTTNIINMAQATEQMLNHEYPQPIILLKRICIDKYSH